MLLIDDTGTTLASGDPTVKMSSAPDRTWLSMSVLPPSWLLGKIWMSTRPLVAARIASHASEARLLIGWAAGRSLPYFKLNSAALARWPVMLAPATAPAPDRICPPCDPVHGVPPRGGVCLGLAENVSDVRLRSQAFPPP